MRVRLAAAVSAACTASALVAGCGLAGLPAHAAQQRASSCPWVGSHAPVSTRVAEVLHRMTLTEKVGMLHGSGSGPYVGDVAGIPALCIPALKLEDGPAGVADGVGGVTQLPAPVAGAASFDPSLMRDYGAVVGAEEWGKGANVDLGPTVNIVRDPRWGRAFETYGEDPYLAGQIAAGEVVGVQGQGVLAMVKHYAVYNQETYRNTAADDAIVSDRVMHEIYLPQFQAAVSEGGAASVMCGYSSVNGSPDCQNGYLLGALDGQVGFGGFVTSDWGATRTTVASANAGLDLEMPGDPFFGTPLEGAVTGHEVSMSRLDDMVSRILTEMFRFGLLDRPQHGTLSSTVTSSGHDSVARAVAEQGTVLLKNARSGRSPVLPLNGSEVQSIAVIGDDASTGAAFSGGGAAGVKGSRLVTPLKGITKRAGHRVTVRYAPSNTAGAVSAARSSTVAVVFASYSESEGTDLTSIGLPAGQNDLISAVAAANPNTIVVLNTGSAVTMPWLGRVKGVLEAWYPGGEDGDAIASVLFGDTDPSGKLPVTFPRSLSGVPAGSAAQWPGTGGKVRYSEGLDVGYRWYDAKKIAPLFPFGYGLSYTSFRFSDLAVTPTATTPGGRVMVSAEVTNTGSRAGADTAQLYVGDPAATGEPPRQLKGFQKVSLAPGQSRLVSFTLDADPAFAYWSSQGWRVRPGNYKIMVGDSSAHLPLTATVNVG